MRLFLERLSTMFGSLTESVADLISMKELKRISVPVGSGLLYFSYRRYQRSGLRLFVGVRDIEGTQFQELSTESVIRLRDAFSAFLKDAETNASSDRMDEMYEINIPFTNGNLVQLRRDNVLHLWLKAREENVASEGNRLPLWIHLQGSGRDDIFKEVPTAAAALIINALDGFLLLAGVPQKQ